MTDADKPDDPKPDKKDDFEFPALHADEPQPPAEPAPATETPSPIAPEEPSKIKRLIEQARPWVLKNKNLSMGIAFALAVLLMFTIYKIRSAGGSSDPDVVVDPVQPDEIPVNAMEARLGRFQDTINAVGTLKGEAEIELRFQVDGRIEEFNVQEGAKVRKGQIIARINERDARLKTERAKLELEQTEKLYDLGGVSKTKLDESRLNLEVAMSELDKTRIVASRDGIIGEKEAEVGEFVNPQRKIAKLVSIKNVVVEVGIIEKQVDKVYPGQKLLVTVDAYPGNVFEGTIESISPLIGSDGSKTFSMRSKIPNPDSLLLPGMFARSKIITYEKDDAISVPNDALVKTAGGFQVFVVNKDNIAEARDVQVGYVSTEFTEISGGLTPGEIVVIQKPPELKAGSKVKIIEVQK